MQLVSSFSSSPVRLLSCTVFCILLLNRTRRANPSDVPIVGDSFPQKGLVRPHEGSDLAAFFQKEKGGHRPYPQDDLDRRDLVDVDLDKDNVRIRRFSCECVKERSDLFAGGAPSRIVEHDTIYTYIYAIVSDQKRSDQIRT